MTMVFVSFIFFIDYSGRPRFKKLKRRYWRRFKTIPCCVRSDIISNFNDKQGYDASPESSRRNRNLGSILLSESLNRCLDLIENSLHDSSPFKHWNSDRPEFVPKLDLSFLNESDSNRSDRNTQSPHNSLAILTIYQSPRTEPTRPDFVPKLDLSFLNDSYNSDDNNCSVQSPDDCFIIQQRQYLEPVRPKNVPKLDLSFFCDSGDRKTKAVVSYDLLRLGVVDEDASESQNGRSSPSEPEDGISPFRCPISVESSC